MHSTKLQKPKRLPHLLFAFLLSLVLVDRILTLFAFGFEFTDIDQLVLWNGAIDYSQGIFHEPFFYGQSYNYMLESLLSVPLIWAGIPIYKALPIITTCITLFPFITFAILLFKRKNYFWSYLCLSLPLLLPLHYNFLTTISRGFVQAFVFIPLLLYPLIEPQTNRSSYLIYIASALCIVANQSAILIVFPVFLWVYMHHWKSKSFYLKSLVLIPFLTLDYLAHYFYKMHPERVLHGLSGIRILSDTFLASLKNLHHFDGIFPILPCLGILYPILFILLAIVAWRKSLKKQFITITSFTLLLLLTLAIPKVQEVYPSYAGIFFTPNRLYIYLPLILFIFSYLLFRDSIRSKSLINCLILLCCITSSIKYMNIKQAASIAIKETTFPVAKNSDLIQRSNEIKLVSNKYGVDLVIQPSNSGWNPILDSYAFYPITYEKTDFRNTVSINIKGDRRLWLYTKVNKSKIILFNDIKVDEERLKQFDYKKINSKQILITNTDLTVSELLTELNLDFTKSI